MQVAAAGPPGTLADADQAGDHRDAEEVHRRRDDRPAPRQEGRRPQRRSSPPRRPPSLAGPDRAAAVDEGMPKATSIVKASTPPVPMVALSDPTGAIDLVGTTLFLDVNTKASRRSGACAAHRRAGAQARRRRLEDLELQALGQPHRLRPPHADDELDGEERTMIQTLRRHPFVTATVTVPVVDRAHAGRRLHALAQRRPDAVRVRRGLVLGDQDRGGRLHARARRAGVHPGARQRRPARRDVDRAATRSTSSA